MEKLKIGFKKCLLSLIAGLFWIVYLFKSIEDSGYESMGCVFLSFGIVVPISTPFFFSTVLSTNYSFFLHFLVGIFSYLFIGLIANLVIRQEWGGNGFLLIPYVKEGKVFI